jgi:hypothetical protein
MNALSRFVSFSATRLIVVFIFSLMAVAMPGKASAPDCGSGEKELYVPSGIRFVPDDNDFHDKQSDFSFYRMVESDNMAIFWHREYGDDPMANPDESRRFDVHYALEECERYYNYYVNELKLVEKGNSISDRYKLLLIVFGGDVATAFGGGAEEKVGIMWTNSTRINKPPYGVLAHEMAHSFQYMARIDNGGGPRGPIMEVSAQYLLWQVLPEWMTFENYHLVDFMTSTHYAFLHQRNMYNSPYVLEYWSQKHGKTLFGRILRETAEGEDPVMTYQRIAGIDQEAFNDEMFDAARRFITWDLERVRDLAGPYANQHSTLLNANADGWFRIDPSKCPQNYGYNGIRLNVPAAGTKVQLEFQGIAGTEGFNAVNVDKAGWRYGFLASLEDGGRVYGEVFSDPDGVAGFTVPENTAHLWLVVSGAPKTHWPVVMRRNAAPDEDPEENWPYQIRLSGTSPHEAVIH